MDFSTLRGFGYQPSWGTCGLEIWRNFDAVRFGQELSLGRSYFPWMNAVRIFLSHEAWQRDAKRFEMAFEAALAACAERGLKLIPALFNRWHDSVLDYGGIYVDHFLPGLSWLRGGQTEAFAEAIMGPHAGDDRILVWDLCNEPFWGNPRQNMEDAIFRAEFAWLEGLYRVARRVGVRAPITIGLTMATPLELTEPLCDVLEIHPYWTGDPKLPNESAEFERYLDNAVAFAEKTGKPLFAGECCWGSFDDARRVEMVRYSLEQLNRRKIGWLAYVLCHSAVIDCHRPEYGPISNPGNLAFIEVDGILRPGHEIIDRFGRER